jgi:hypothetical protein
MTAPETAALLSYGPRLKIERAKHHIADLNTRIEAILAEKPFHVVRHYQPKARKVSLLTKSNKPSAIPDEFSLIIGDAAHNLRSALDLTMYAIAKRRAPSVHKIEFPFPRKAEGLEGAINAAQVKFAGTNVVEVVRALKPYPDGNKFLWRLHATDVRDKHHLLVLSRRVAQITGDEIGALLGPVGGPKMSGPGVLQFTGPEDQPFFTITDATFGRSRIERRAIVRQGDWEEKTDIQPAFCVAFGIGEPFSGISVIVALNRCLETVKEAVDSLIAAYLAPSNVFPS